jgi:hypothetical protein
MGREGRTKLKPRLRLEELDHLCHAKFSVRIGKTADNADVRRSTTEHLRKSATSAVTTGSAVDVFRKISAMANGKQNMNLSGSAEIRAVRAD